MSKFEKRFLCGRITKEEYNLHLGECLDAEVKGHTLLRIYERCEVLPCIFLINEKVLTFEKRNDKIKNMSIVK